MLLKELLRGVPHIQTQGPLAVDIKGIAFDSREVQEGDLFVCLSGTRTDGHQFIHEAMNKGAVAVVVIEGADDYAGIHNTVIKAEKPRHVLSKLADKYYGHPSHALRVIGVTGTNGKTTTTHLIDRLLSAGTGEETGLMGTISYNIGRQKRPVEATTPEALVIHRIFKEMVGQGIRYCTMEVSSHALALSRVDQCDFNAAVLTNITEDHLDFHKDFASYQKAKARLFRGLAKKPGNYAVINNDDPSAPYLRKITTADVITYGVNTAAHVRAVDIDIRPSGVSYRALTPWGNLDIGLKITGLFSVYNSLAAIAVALREGIEPETVKKVLAKVEGIPGRLEKIEVGQDFTVLVDYAHTPDGLENVLSTVRQFCPGNLLVVFGCGGERDRTKRPLMASIALKYSDFAIITNDNPRGEPVRQILADMMTGVAGQVEGKEYAVILDRDEAIGAAISRAKSGDIVVIAGKGHETYQVFADRTIDFDDREVARRYLRKKLTNQP
jgi:UDP-N-acetylmuramoyl-L-alanyl-D-glutamate--2,6-diaminopimelate ligase